MQTAGYVICERTKLLAYFPSGRFRGLSHCKCRASFTVLSHLMQGVRRTIPCGTADISFAFGVLQQYEMRTGKQEFLLPEVLPVWKYVLLPTWRGARSSDMASCIKHIFNCLSLRCFKGTRVASGGTPFEILRRYCEELVLVWLCVNVYSGFTLCW